MMGTNEPKRHGLRTFNSRARVCAKTPFPPGKEVKMGFNSRARCTRRGGAPALSSPFSCFNSHVRCARSYLSAESMRRAHFNSRALMYAEGRTDDLYGGSSNSRARLCAKGMALIDSEGLNFNSRARVCAKLFVQGEYVESAFQFTRTRVREGSLPVGHRLAVHVSIHAHVCARRTIQLPASRLVVLSTHAHACARSIIMPLAVG